MQFLETTVVLTKGNISVRRKALIKKETITAVQELNAQSCLIWIERRDGSVDDYVIETTFSELKESLNEHLQSHSDTSPSY